MVEVVGSLRLNADIRDPRTSRNFPSTELEAIKSAVEAVDDAVFLDSEGGHELVAFDDGIATDLSEYEYEHAPDSGRNPACKLWSDEGFDHSVDLYHPHERIAVEIEKSERKRVSDDLLKFIKGGKTRRENRDRIEFGCLIVPTNYRGSDNIFGGTEATLRFMRSILHVEDVAVIGYRDPRFTD